MTNSVLTTKAKTRQTHLRNIKWPQKKISAQHKQNNQMSKNGENKPFQTKAVNVWIPDEFRKSRNFPKSSTWLLMIHVVPGAPAACRVCASFFVVPAAEVDCDIRKHMVKTITMLLAGSNYENSVQIMSNSYHYTCAKQSQSWSESTTQYHISPRTNNPPAGLQHP